MLEYRDSRLKDILLLTYLLNISLIRISDLNSKPYIWSKTGMTDHLIIAIHAVKYGGGRTMLCGCFDNSQI